MRADEYKSILDRVPWWLVTMALVFCWTIYSFIAIPDFKVIFKAVSSGIYVTILVSIIAYAISISLGLLISLMRSSKYRILREIATLYTELIRGLPMLVILYFIAFVGAPAIVSAVNFILSPLIKMGYIVAISPRDLNFVFRAVLALTIGYSAFIAEIFRAGIQSVTIGQKEAALALGLTRSQTMFKVVLPQAFKNILPALANEFIAIIKDSSLVSVLGVQDITQLGKVYSAATFRFFDTYIVVAFFYLVLTISLSLLIRRLEKKVRKGSL